MDTISSRYNAFKKCTERDRHVAFQVPRGVFPAMFVCCENMYTEIHGAFYPLVNEKVQTAGPRKLRHYELYVDGLFIREERVSDTG